MRKIAILQPNYIPWKGVFDLINQVDVFVFFDDVQYTSKDWRNRNKIKTANGEVWLTVPVKTKGLRDQLIGDAEINTSENWQLKHLRTIQLAYQKAPYYKEFEYLLEEIYIKNRWHKISELDIFSTKILAKAIGVDAEWVVSSELQCGGGKDGERIIEICNKLNCDYFINGPTARAFINQQLFDEADIALDYIEYDYQEYEQPFPPFSHYVSALDLLFNCGKKAIDYINKME